MECLDYNPKYIDGVPDWYKKEQEKLRDVFIARKKEALSSFIENSPEAPSGMVVAYEEAIDHLLREKLDYWGE